MVLAIRCVVLMPDKDEIFIDFCIGIFNLHQTNKGSPFCRAAFFIICCFVVWQIQITTILSKFQLGFVIEIDMFLRAYRTKRYGQICNLLHDN